jgi:hypothetical protein
VPSRAWVGWDGARAKRLDQLVAAHAAIGGTDRGRRTLTEPINWALVLILAAEFQGYVRELHDECSDAAAAGISGGNLIQFAVVRNSLTTNRGLDRVNAKTETISEDFGRFGIDVWAQIKSSVASGVRWKTGIDRLNTARNGIAHHELAKLHRLRADGYPLILSTVKSWRTACTGVARHLDRTLGAHLKQVTGVDPW